MRKPLEAAGRPQCRHGESLDLRQADRAARGGGHRLRTRRRAAAAGAQSAPHHRAIEVAVDALDRLAAAPPATTSAASAPLQDVDFHVRQSIAWSTRSRPGDRSRPELLATLEALESALIALETRDFARLERLDRAIERILDGAERPLLVREGIASTPDARVRRARCTCSPSPRRRASLVPAGRDPSGRAGGMRNAAANGRKRRILVVEDDAVIASAISAYLRAAGYEVDAVDDGLKALRRIRYASPDAIVLDLMLPGTDGWQVIESVRADGVEAAVVVVSARVSERDRVHALRMGADDYLCKPFGMPELVARVESALRRTSGGFHSTNGAIEQPGLVID